MYYILLLASSPPHSGTWHIKLSKSGVQQPKVVLSMVSLSYYSLFFLFFPEPSGPYFSYSSFLLINSLLLLLFVSLLLHGISVYLCIFFHFFIEVVASVSLFSPTLTLVFYCFSASLIPLWIAVAVAFFLLICPMSPPSPWWLCFTNLISSWIIHDHKHHHTNILVMCLSTNGKRA